MCCIKRRPKLSCSPENMVVKVFVCFPVPACRRLKSGQIAVLIQINILSPPLVIQSPPDLCFQAVMLQTIHIKILFCLTVPPCFLFHDLTDLYQSPENMTVIFSNRETVNECTVAHGQQKENRSSTITLS